MREQPPSDSRPEVRQTTVSVDIVMIARQTDSLAVLCARSADRRSRIRWVLPWDAPHGEESLADAAARLTRSTLGSTPGAIEQIRAFGDTRRHPGDAEISVGFFALVSDPDASTSDSGRSWFPVHELPTLAPRHRAIVDAALEAIVNRLDQSPLAFRLLPPTFTLSELQSIYELLLARPLHKASFRRALQTARLVEPTDEWRSEGRGRPAQLFRYAPKKHRDTRRGVRFDVPSE
jgi:hypothetical protein